MELMHKYKQNLLPRKLTKALNELTKSKNTRNNNYRIPAVYRKGDLFYEILNTWNNIPNEMKEIPNKHTTSKSMIKNFLKKQYEHCHVNNCESCKVTPFNELKN